MQAGMAMAQQMMQENPEAVEQMRQMMGGMMGGPNPSSKQAILYLFVLNTP